MEVDPSEDREKDAIVADSRHAPGSACALAHASASACAHEDVNQVSCVHTALACARAREFAGLARLESGNHVRICPYQADSHALHLGKTGQMLTAVGSTARG